MPWGQYTVVDRVGASICTTGRYLYSTKNQKEPAQSFDEAGHSKEKAKVTKRRKGEKKSSSKTTKETTT